MHVSKLAASAGIILLVAGLTVLSVLALLQTGVFAYTGGGRLIQIINLVYHYLGHSILFFIPTFLCYSLFSWLLWANLTRFNHDPSVDLADNVRYYSVGVDLFITLFFAIGVLFTAWGMQNALVSTLGSISRDEAGRIGAWEYSGDWWTTASS